jgi:redox-sensitive bicupin YhaK (pirin superfamily)
MRMWSSGPRRESRCHASMRSAPSSSSPVRRKRRGQALAATQMVVFGGGAEAVVQATAPSVLMLLGGAPVGERFIEWNFVSSSKERIAQAKRIGALGA